MKKFGWKAVVLTGIMVTVTAIGGCSKNQVATSVSQEQGEQTREAVTFPLDHEINVILAGVREDGFVPFADCQTFQDLEKATNIKVKWLDWPQSQQKEKRNLAFASGDLPDAFYGSWSLDKADVVKYGAEGILLRLNDYLNEDYMPNFTRVLKGRPELMRELSTPQGDVYALPTLDENSLPLTNDTLLINKEWLDKVGMEMPETIDDFFLVLMALKEAGDLNGNGKDDEVPLTFKFGENNLNMGLSSLMGYTGVVSNSAHTRMAMKDGKPVFAPATDEYKEYMVFMNKLFANGLIDREAFTMDSPAYSAKTQTSVPTAGVISNWSAESVNRPIPGNDPLKEGVYVYMPPLKKDKDSQQLWGRRVNALNSNLSFAISAATKYPEELVRWIDLAYEKNTSIENYLGKIGVHIQDEGDGKFTKIMNSSGKPFTNDEKSGLVPNKFAVAYILKGDMEFIDKVNSPQNKAAADEFYKPYLQKDFVKAAMTTQEENDKLVFLTTDLLSYVDQSTAKFITEGGIMEGWDSYIAQLKKLGLDEYVEIQTQIHNRANNQ